MDFVSHIVLFNGTMMILTVCLCHGIRIYLTNQQSTLIVQFMDQTLIPLQEFKI